ncbi:MAG: hypothetical protein E6R08_00795 [Nevskiaceae bacterium]|nr:MAG: hypothetical protein E6R08_00795 [Nevskiaceae bacterium]
MTPEIAIDPIYAGWEKLSIYKVNREQIWLALNLQDALEGAALHFRLAVEEVHDELCPPERLGGLRLLLLAAERTDFERTCANRALERLNEGLMPPLLVGLLADC